MSNASQDPTPVLASPPIAVVPATASDIRLAKAEAQRAKNIRRGPVYPTSVSWPAVLSFAAISCGLGWLVQLPIWFSGEGLSDSRFMLTTLAMMYTPTIAALVCVLFIRRPASIPRLLGLSPLRPIGRTLLFCALAFVGVPVLAFLAMLLGSALGLIRLDFVSYSGLDAAMAAAGQNVPGLSIEMIVLINVVTLPIAIVSSSFAAFGEELGWRGWLLPNLRPLGTWPALLITGVIWGVWHSPIILLGYNYGRTDLVGVALMTAWCVLLGIIFGWLRLRTASVWPAVIAHGAINAATTTWLVTFSDAHPGENAVWGTILGVPGAIVLVGLIVALTVSGQLRKQPQPGLRLDESSGEAASPRAS
ncbi:CPBP family intramembrane metalloprotease [Agreia pratensis]|uniref:CAAX protease self-immunity n=1 Tax=Agreia pratensis TaxID=150121 RepID=A0A1X7KN81_9MICO|nr:type II CAAX endopeptidase family protein [Agreia pratensis]MBF4634514.1 CPBP family intramembrane metalloprotease [Agreia pratensis]SMG42622.1 CAAX protease self-immunity [Agreia pratensis]